MSGEKSASLGNPTSLGLISSPFWFRGGLAVPARKGGVVCARAEGRVGAEGRATVGPQLPLCLQGLQERVSSTG